MAALRQGASRWGQTQLGVLALEVLTHLLVVLLGAVSFRAILTYSLRALKKKGSECYSPWLAKIL